MECRFELDAPFYNRDAGFSVWTFGRRHGKEYFIKQFLDPVYPEGDVPGAQAQREYCRRFEEEKCGLYRAISEASDGNVVLKIPPAENQIHGCQAQGNEFQFREKGGIQTCAQAGVGGFG